MAAIHEHPDLSQVALLLSEGTGTPSKLPSDKQVCKEVHRLGSDPELVALREGAKAPPRARQCCLSEEVALSARLQNRA